MGKYEVKDIEDSSEEVIEIIMQDFMKVGDRKVLLALKTRDGKIYNFWYREPKVSSISYTL